MKKIAVSLLLALGLVATSFAGDLNLEAQFEITGKVPGKNFLTIKGAAGSVEKDTVDVVTGASKAKATELLNSYRNGPDKKASLPAGLQSLFKYGVSPEKQFAADALTVTKAADGTITIQYVHRGRAFKMVSDKKGQFGLPTGDYKSRVVAWLEKDGTNTVAKEFSPTGKVADINWAKVWDTAVPDGTVLGKLTDKEGKVTEVKTSKVLEDTVPSANPYTGFIQASFASNILVLKADLSLKK